MYFPIAVSIMDYIMLFNAKKSNPSPLPLLLKKRKLLKMKALYLQAMMYVVIYAQCIESIILLSKRVSRAIELTATLFIINILI